MSKNNLSDFTLAEGKWELEARQDVMVLHGENLMDLITGKLSKEVEEKQLEDMREVCDVEG